MHYFFWPTDTIIKPSQTNDPHKFQSLSNFLPFQDQNLPNSSYKSIILGGDKLK